MFNNSTQHLPGFLLLLVLLTASLAGWQTKIPAPKAESSAEDKWQLPNLPHSNKDYDTAALRLRQLNPWGPEEVQLSEAETNRKKRIEEALKQREKEEVQAELTRKKKLEEEELNRQQALARQKALEEQQRQQALAQQLAQQKALEEQQRQQALAQQLAQQKALEEQQRLAEELKKQQQQLLKQNFVGVVQQGNQTFVLLLENNGTVRYTSGSELPSYGVKLAAIHRDFIEVKRGEAIEVFSLYNDEHLKKQRPVTEVILQKPAPETSKSKDPTVKEPSAEKVPDNKEPAKSGEPPKPPENQKVEDPKPNV